MQSSFRARGAIRKFATLVKHEFVNEKEKKREKKENHVKAIDDNIHGFYFISRGKSEFDFVARRIQPNFHELQIIEEQFNTRSNELFENYSKRIVEKLQSVKKIIAAISTTIFLATCVVPTKRIT